MLKPTDKIPDIRFSFNHVKPFANNRELFSKLETSIYNNVDDFKDTDWIHDCRSNNISNLRGHKIENAPLKKKLDDIKPLANYTKDILKEINKEVKMDDDLIKYIKTENVSMDGGDEVENESNNTNNTNNTEYDENVNNLVESSDDESDDNSNNDVNDYYSSYSSTSGKRTIDDFNTEMKYVDTDDITTYTTTPGRLLSYQTVCNLTKAIARSRLTMNMKKDDSIKYAEEQERLKLKQELEKYMKMSQIKTDLSSNFNVDIDEMSLKQLQYYSNEAKNMFEKLKTTQVIIDGIDVVDKVQTTVFKDGIRIPGTKKAVKFNNIGGALKCAVFDKKSPLYVSYENLIEKYNLRVSDELLAVLTLMNTIFKNAEIVDIKDKKKKKENSDSNNSDDSENKEDSEEDSNSENSEEDSNSNSENSEEDSNSNDSESENE